MWLMYFLTLDVSWAFTTSTTRLWGMTGSQQPRRARPNWLLFDSNDPDKTRFNNDDDGGVGVGEIGKGPNWLEKSFPVKTEGTINPKTVEDYNLGLSGRSWQVGPLSLRMYDAITDRSSALDQAPATSTTEILRTLKIYALDFSAKEAVRAALLQNGLEMVLTAQEEDVGMWGDVESIRLLDETTGVPIGPVYDDWEEAVDFWTPGQPFDFVVRQVPAKMRELTIEELLRALDPDGKLREQARDAGMTNLLPVTDECESLLEMTEEIIRRVEASPQHALADNEAFIGDENIRGYRVLAAEQLDDWMSTPSENLLRSKTFLHVMDALVSHGCLIVDITNGGKDMEPAHILAEMWSTTEAFFSKVDSLSEDEKTTMLPPMTVAVDAGSPYAKIGYLSQSDDTLQFFETRFLRATQEILPVETLQLVGVKGMESLRKSNQLMTNIGKSIVRIAVAASTLEAASSSPGSIPGDFDAVMASHRVAEELVDDGLPLSDKGTGIGQYREVAVSMTAHRLCRYSNKSRVGSIDLQSSREIFGAHTDTTFITVIPVASVAGFEVFDETATKWYRPELAARRHYENNTKGCDVPWHARYVLAIPGELLQILTRQEILASVHRVVVATDGCRYSAPLLLRGRTGVSLDAVRYWGKISSPLMQECDMKSMEEIHAAMQPKRV